MNVAYRFNNILIMYFVVGVVDTVRTFSVLIGLITKKHSMIKIYTLMSCIECIAFVALICLNLFRLNYPGQVCSGDIEEYSAEGTLPKRGEFMLYLIYAVWLMIAVACCFVCLLPVLVTNMTS